MMKVQMPKGTNILRLIAAYFACFPPLCGTSFSRAALWRSPFATHASGLHETSDGRIRTARSQRGVRLHCADEIVVVQLVTPVAMFAVLLPKLFGQLGTHRHFARVLSDRTPQSTDRIIALIASFVIPTL